MVKCHRFAVHPLIVLCEDRWHANFQFTPVFRMSAPEFRPHSSVALWRVEVRQSVPRAENKTRVCHQKRLTKPFPLSRAVRYRNFELRHRLLQKVGQPSASIGARCSRSHRYRTFIFLCGHFCRDCICIHILLYLSALKLDLNRGGGFRRALAIHISDLLLLRAPKRLSVLSFGCY